MTNELEPMQALRRSDLTKEKAWSLYLDNLRLVLDSAEILLENLDAEKVVITAEHGEAFGEYGGKFGHIDGYPTPQVKKVPWIETSATDTDSYHPSEQENSGEQDYELRDHLKDLRYL